MKTLPFLLATDNDVVRQQFQRELSAACMMEVSSLESLLESLEISQPKQILLDIYLPEKGGMFARKKLDEMNADFRMSLFTSGHSFQSSSGESIMNLPAIVKYVRRHLLIGGEDPLTPVLSGRETEVLRRVADGYSNKEISAIMAIGMETVRTYRKQILKKLSANNGPAMVNVAYQLGLLSA